jgi:hypothetical protein
MILKLNQLAWSVVRPRVTPDPKQAAELERRRKSLTYTPSNGFHRDVRPMQQGSEHGEQAAAS